MSESSARRALVQRILDALDPEVVPDVLQRYGRAPRVALPSPAQHLVLVGQRGAGKTRTLPWIAQLLERPAIDLDEEISRRHGRSLRDWVRDDVTGFRAAERATFSALTPPAVVSAGGGFLSLHPDLLAAHVPVLIPIGFAAYRERLLQDTTRPRLRPELSLDEEIRSVFFEREAAHLSVSTVHLGELLRAAVDR